MRKKLVEGIRDLSTYVVKQAFYGLHSGVKDDKMMLEIFNL